ncbi:MAG TPA: IS1595 family transposase [Stellaceae bacterium]|nr:IS1595 family transposase [Stellaceae bacterium]
MAIITQPYFWDEEAAHAKLEQLVWPEGPICPHCGASGRIGSVTGKGARTALKFCCHCRKQFRATMGTMFEGSHVPLHKWFQACFLLTATHKGISPHQLHLRLEVTNKTALAMVHRLETATRAAARGPSAGTTSEDYGPARGLRRRVRWRAGPATGSGLSSTEREGRREAFEIGAPAPMEEREEVPWAKAPAGPGRQFRAFVETARELGYDEDGGAFEEMLARIARYQPPGSSRRRPAAGAGSGGFADRSAAASSEARTRRFG